MEKRERKPAVTAKPRAKRQRIVAACAMLALACGLLVCAAGCSCSESPAKDDGTKKQEQVSDQKAVPNVMGMTKDDAARLLSETGFKVGTVTEEESETVAAGMVASQSPKSGGQAKPGATVDYVVSKGVKKAPAQVAVPDLAGMTQTQAEEALAKAKLVAKAEDPVYADGVEPGRVFRQSAAAGTQIEEGSVVSFTAALGREVAAVPNVAGKGKDAAIAALTAASFNVDVIELYSATVAAGNVVGQNPNPRIQCVKGTTVTISVSKGPAPAPKEQVAMPDFMTMTIDQVEAVCASAGLKCKFTGPDDGLVVVAQSIAAATLVDRGTTVTLTLEPIPYAAQEG